MEEFFTSDKSQDGVRLPLQRPDGGKSEHWLLVRGIDSDAFHKADFLAKRERSLIEAEASGIKDKTERADFLFKKVTEQEIAIIAALVADWSFDKAEGFNPDEKPEWVFKRANVKRFLRKAPQIKDQIDRFSARRSAFFGNGSDSLKPSQEVK